MLTGEQIRAARALVRMEQAELAQRSGVSLPSIKRLEGTQGALSTLAATEEAIRRALVDAGVMFLDGDLDGGPGVRLGSRGKGAAES